MKKIAIFGFGITGQAAARYFLAQKKTIAIFDSRKESEIDPEIIKDFSGAEFNFEKNEIADWSDIDMLFVSPGVSNKLNIFEQAKSAGIPIHNDLTLFIEEWKNRGPIVGVTGSNGKSTIVSLIHNSIQASSKNSILVGNIGKSPLDELSKGHPDGTVVVIEISSYQAEQFKEKHAVDIAVISNITENHLDRYDGDIQTYAKTKLQITSKEFTKIITTTDDFGIKKYVMPHLNVKNVTDVSLKGGENRMLNEINIDKLNLRGEHNLYNVAFCLEVLNKLEIELDDKILNFIYEYKGLEHRNEKVRTISGIDFVNDSKSTSPDALRVSLEAFGQNKNIVLIGGGADKQVSFDILNEHFNQFVKFMVIFDNKINEQMAALCNRNNVPHQIVKDMKEAVEIALEKSEEGDTVLLSPGAASFGQFKDFEHRGEVFKEEVSKL